jgi:site-specific recombinase XerD
MKRTLKNMKMMGEFEKYLREEERSSATIEKYLRDVRSFAAFVGDAEISKNTVLNYKSKLLETYAISSANSMIAAINCFFRFYGWYELCVKQFKMQRNAFCSEERELTRDEYLRLIETANSKNNLRLSLIIQTICSTGIRVSELQYITVEAVNRGEAVVNCKGKTRRIFIISGLKKRLLQYIKDKKISSGTVFITKGGRAISRNNVWKEMKSLCDQANVSRRKVFPHNLRHLFARTFYGIEKDIAKLADILGHSSIDTTRIYIVTTGAEHRKKMENMKLII